MTHEHRGTGAPSAVERAREASSRGEWSDAYATLHGVDPAELGPTGLETLADAAWWMGETDESLALRQKAYAAFAATSEEYPAAALSVTPHLLAASFSCAYRFTPTNGLPPREDRLEFMFTSDDGDDRLQIKHHGTGQVFTNADALSEYLLVPVFTGRPR